MPSLLDGLNEAQRAAVTSPFPVLQVLAGPGSGKTKVTTSRVAYLIAHQGFKPWNIIVCTFTVKAAKEMKERLEGFLGKETANRLVIGTFHSIARKYLAKYGERIGLDKKFGVADTSDSGAIINRVKKKFNLQIKPNVARGRISKLKSERISPDQHAAQSSGSRTKTSVDEVQLLQEITIAYREYEEELRKQNLLDYDDLLLQCARLLERYPECVDNIDAVLIDEFQDTNNVQYDLMNSFSQRKHHICIVGDPDQSIYGWRSAKIENLDKMRQQYPDTHTVNLEENYRSSALILMAAAELIEQDQARPSKSLIATHSIGSDVVLRKLSCAEHEAKWIVSELQRIQKLAGGLLEWSDFAVLLRSANLSRLIETGLAKVGIPYCIVGGNRFYDRFEVKLVLDYLRVLEHPSHDDAVRRVINTPPRGVAAESLAAISEEAEERKLSLWEFLTGMARDRIRVKYDTSNQFRKGVTNFVNLIEKYQSRLGRESDETLAEFTERYVEELKLHKYLQTHYKDDWEARWANVEELLAQANEASATRDELPSEDDKREGSGEERAVNTSESRSQALRSFLDNVALTTKSDGKDAEGKELGRVTLSTMHAAKGLEWPVVFIPAAYEGCIPHSRAEDADEERRLLYVAMTRAQAMLYLSQPLEDSRNRARTTLSQFLCHEGVAGRLVPRGSSINFDFVYEMSKILRRPCPGGKELQARRAQVSRLEDDEYEEDPLPKTEQKTNEQMMLKEGDGNRLSKGTWKPKGAFESLNQMKRGYTARTTMDSASSFSEKQVPFNAGFTTARSLPLDKPSRTSKNCGPSSEQPARSEPMKRQKTMKHSEKPMNRSSIMQAWLQVGSNKRTTCQEQSIPLETEVTPQREPHLAVQKAAGQLPSRKTTAAQPRTRPVLGRPSSTNSDDVVRLMKPFKPPSRNRG